MQVATDDAFNIAELSKELCKLGATEQQSDFIHMADLRQKGRVMHGQDNRPIAASFQRIVKPCNRFLIDCAKALAWDRGIQCY